MESQIFGVIGSVLLLGAVAALWIGRLNKAAGSVSDPDERHADVAAEPSPSLKINMPRHLAVAAPADEEPAKKEQVVEVAAALVDEREVEVRPLVDCADAAMNLHLADQLKVVGDFEGVAEYAKLVLEMDTASVKQRERAHHLLRREMAR
ncbi:hypothetical protein IIE18_11060 [Pseudomonas sp. V1]|uniref:hypothetical protein n=1 Tax=Pseudomonas arcuscaelestis TaxID=2710591 RepID=UPI00193EF565|nr:hypothetical protein [Pseudomonas arcuscaelestis]MBM3105679.1 hypothetical protein [Pseudomonas arcuscaelestis]